ncbi:MAG: 50S ribosomal protein L28 [Chloroflexi bacterium]|nr:50S ribosomal protein L28 [Chloroflexota bacterium]
MAVKCEVCGKIPQYGHNVSHSKRRTPRRWLPNVHRQLVMIEGEAKRVSICTRCLRTLSRLPR